MTYDKRIAAAAEREEPGLRSSRAGNRGIANSSASIVAATSLSPSVKTAKDLLLKILAYPRPLRLVLARHLIKTLSLFSYKDRLIIGAIDRPHYGYCIFQAAKLASLLNYPTISVIEFGAGGGNGLLNAEMHITEVMKLFAVDIQLYGFDTGSGLPIPQDYRDTPHYFQPGLYAMDCESLKRKLKRAKLVIGDVKDTCSTFFDEYNPGPIGCILYDLDLYSSTGAALTLFDADASHFLPRIFMYFDDIVGDDVWLCNEFMGELLAIDEFNRAHELKKIAQIRSLDTALWWAKQIYVYHDFAHPKYNVYVAANEQVRHEHFIKLK